MRGCVLILLVFFGGPARSAFAASPDEGGTVVLPPILQATLFRKIFAYNRKLPPIPRILVVYANEFAPMAEELRKQMDKLDFRSETTNLADFSPRVKGVDVVYVLAAATPPVVRAFCLKEQIFSVSPIPSLAERGEVSVGIGLREDHKTEIIVHLGRSRQEGQELTMALLSLSRVVR